MFHTRLYNRSAFWPKRKLSCQNFIEQRRRSAELLLDRYPVFGQSLAELYHSSCMQRHKKNIPEFHPLMCEQKNEYRSPKTLSLISPVAEFAHYEPALLFYSVVNQ